ncbi:MAG: hypothetical protein IFK94_13010 [Acidobacteria bacterium]|uniref:PKD/Chitinase domain-containing protein n=1 Tax=Candidatus Polarisedimenticola svalbardensis TaxID=2886004 RepID=A0A8J6XY99_9BACT|nr:hypothetical protein [Candidatus Polarisedimenticola svalbardensis]
MMRRPMLFGLGFFLFLLLLPCSHSAEGPPADLPSEEEHTVRAAEAGKFFLDPAVDEPGVGLQEVFRRSFQPPVGVTGGFKAIPSTPYIMAFSEEGHLFTVNPTEATVLNQASYSRYGFGEALGGDSHRRRLLLPGHSGRWSPEPTRILDVTDPLNFREIPTDAQCGTGAVILPGAELGLTFGDYRKTCLIDLDTGDVRHTFQWTVEGAYGVLRNSEPAVFLEGTSSYALYGVMNPDDPTRWYSMTTPPYSNLAIDREHRFTVVASYSEVQIRDLPTGAILSVIGPPHTTHMAELIQGQGRQILALALSGQETIELYDIADLSAPRWIRSLDVGPIGLTSMRGDSMDAHDELPYLAIATKNLGGVVVFDVEKGTEILRHVVEGTDARGLEWSETESGDPAIVYAGEFRLDRWNGYRPEGGLKVMDALLVGGSGANAQPKRLLQVVPEVIQAVLPLQGRWMVAVDLGSNAILLLDGSTGEVLDAIGYDHDAPSSRSGLIAAAAGNSFAVGSGRGFNIFDKIGNKLRRRISRVYASSEEGYFHDFEVLPDGTVVVLASHRLLTFTPDGLSGQLDLDGWYGRMSWNSALDRVVLSSGSVWSDSDQHAQMVDLSNPLVPRRLWTTGEDIAFADFVRDHDAVALTVGTGWWGFSPQLVDSASGEPLGEPGKRTPAFFYYGPAAAFGREDEAGLLYWRWTWSGWKSVLYDVSMDIPQVFQESEEYFDPPRYALRSDGRSAYEFRESFEDENSRVVLSLPGGGFQEYGTIYATQPSSLRHGFLAGSGVQTIEKRRDLVILRDPAMNRPPVASAPDQIVECDDATGTPVVLDGSGSSDPDSTPGTDDDISGYAWTVDGDAAGDGETVESSLDLGSHAVELTVTDDLGLTGSDSAVIEVADTLPPELSLDLEPVLQGGSVWANQWQVNSTATDLCDGSLEPSVWVAVSQEVLEATTSYVPATSNRIEIRSGRKGTEVLLQGSDPAFLESIWEQARRDGGLGLDSGQPIELVSQPAPPRGVHRDTVAIYELDGVGNLLSAQAYGEGADIRIPAGSRDSSGHEAVETLSLLEVLAERCRELPAHVSCLP